MSDRSDFLQAVDVEVTRWRFTEIVRREFEHLGRPGAEGGRSGVFTAMTASDRPLDPPRRERPVIATGTRLYVQCIECGQTVACVRFTDARGALVDTWGYVEFPEGGVCHVCLNEPYKGIAL